MNKLYFGLPLAIVAAFFIYFQYSFVPAIREKEHAAEVQKKADEKRRKEEDRISQEESQKLLIADSERRRDERIKREEKEKREKEEREKLKERYDKARGDIGSFERDNRRLEAEIDAEKKLVASAKEEQSSHDKEKEFLRGYISQAEGNAKRMQSLLEQINKVEQLRAQAELAAAAVTREKSN